jgi:hypothetical protein
VDFSSNFKSLASEDVQKAMDEWITFSSFIKGCSDKQRVIIDEGAIVGADPMQYIGTTLRYLFTANATKLNQLSASTICSCSEGNFLTSAICMRSIFEIGSAILLLNEKVLKALRINERANKIREGRNIDEAFSHKEVSRAVKELDKFLRGGALDWEALSTMSAQEFMDAAIDGEGRPIKVKSNMPKGYHVNDSLRLIFKRGPQLKITYAYLSELVHPNVGGTFLIMGDEKSSTAVGFGRSDFEGYGLIFTALQIMRPVLDIITNELKLLEAQSVQASPMPGTVILPQ